MIVRKGSEKEMKIRLKNYRDTRDSILANEKKLEKHFQEKQIRAKRNEKALLFYIDTLKATFPKQFTVLLPVFDGWKKRKYAREAVLAHNDIRKELVKIVPKDELEEKLSKCQEKLRVRIEELQTEVQAEVKAEVK